MNAEQTGLKIRDLREKKGMTQRELAASLGVTDAAVSKWERGKNFPDITLLERLGEVLGCRVSELLGLETGSEEEIVRAVAELSREERKLIRWEILARNFLMLGLAAAVGMIATVLGSALSEHRIYGTPMTAIGALVACVVWMAVVVIGGLFSSRKLVLRNEPEYNLTEEEERIYEEVSPRRRLVTQILYGGLWVYLGVMIILSFKAYSDAAAVGSSSFMARTWFFPYAFFMFARVLLLKEKKYNLIVLAAAVVFMILFYTVIGPRIFPWTAF